MVTSDMLFLCILVVLQVSKINADWQGHIIKGIGFKRHPERYCASSFLAWCTAYKQRIVLEKNSFYHCLPGWTHNNDKNCNIPICSPECQHGGKCVAPDDCNCTASHMQRFTACTTAICSHLFPCYPGRCVYPDSCSCDSGFHGTGRDACLKMTPDKGMPEIGLSTCTLSNGETKFTYITDGYTHETDIIWSNQKDFNYLKFEFQSIYEPMILSKRPIYVQDSKFGIVDATVSVNISKIPKAAAAIRDVAFTKQYNCQGQNDTNPKTSIVNCTFIDDQFSVNIEHGDWLHVVFTAKSGGYRNLVNTDHGNIPWKNQTYEGQIARKEVEFKFDFEAPLHCSELANSSSCRSIDTPLKIENEFTKLPINISWAGWNDELSRMERYHLEVFKLSPDPHGNLEEKSPLTPAFYIDFNHIHDNIYGHIYTPENDGMYSVLLQAADKANNSKIVRRLVLYSPTSNISLNPNRNCRIFVSTAFPETDYMWQTAKVGDKINITVVWANHFINKCIEDGNLLNKVKPYHIQFQEIQGDGILNSSKFVKLDDNEGKRTTSEIPNKHGIIRFEVAVSYSDNTNLPIWYDIANISETFSFSATLNDGTTARIWVRAHDILGNTIVDGTEVHFDTTGPIVTKDSLSLVRNQVNGTYNFTTRIKFKAGDHDSGLHKIWFTLTRDDTGEVKYSGYVSGNSKNINGSCKSHLECSCVLEKCFILDQTLDLDNCWFMTAKEEIDHVNVTVNITVYNQALLSEHLSVKIYNLTTLEGLEKYSGPTNIRVAQNLPNGVRLAWDFPETESCYRMMDIGIILYMLNGTTKLYTVSRSTNFLDIVGLNPEDNYEVAFGLQYGSQRIINMSYRFKTEATKHLVPVGFVIGVLVASVEIIAILIFVFTVLWSKGRLEPFQKHLRNLSLRYRNSIRRAFQFRARSERQQV